jgi:hypothetical protein
MEGLGLQEQVAAAGGELQAQHPGVVGDDLAGVEQGRVVDPHFRRGHQPDADPGDSSWLLPGDST